MGCATHSTKIGLIYLEKQRKLSSVAYSHGLNLHKTFPSLKTMLSDDSLGVCHIGKQALVIILIFIQYLALYSNGFITLSKPRR